MAAKTQTDKISRRMPEGMGGLAKGLAILEALVPHEGRLTISEAAHAAGTSRASARRCLLTLTDLGYLEFDGKFFRPQPRLLLLSSGYSGSRSLAQVAQPILAEARDRLKESVSLAVLKNDNAFFIARAEAERLVNTGIAVGTLIPAHSLATGRVLLGAHHEKWVRAYLERTKLVARTKYSLVRKSDILESIQKAQRQGFAVVDEELEIGLRSIAVPVRDSRRDLVAAVSASVSSARVSIQQIIKDILPVLREHAAKLGRAL